MIPCGGQVCGDVYVGQSGRDLNVRVREHRAYARRHDRSKAVFKHMYDTDHPIDFGGASWVWRSGNERERLVVESALMREVPNFNIMAGASSVDAMCSKLLLKHNKLRRPPDGGG